MYTLTNDEVKYLSENADPKIVAITLKLKESLDKAEFVPKSRLNQEIESKKELETKLKLAEDAKLKAETALTAKDSEIDVQKRSTAELQIKYDDEKKLADAQRNYHKSTVEQAKKALGDKWKDGYANLTIDEILNLVPTIVPQSQGMPPTPPPGTPPDEYSNNNPFSKKTLNLAKQIEITKTKPELARELKARAEKE